MLYAELRECLRKLAYNDTPILKETSSPEGVIVLLLSLFKLHKSGSQWVITLLGGLVTFARCRLVVILSLFFCLIDQILAHLALQVVHHILVENFHPIRQAHQNELRDVDLHQNQKLMQRPKYVAHRCKVDPLVAMQAQQVLIRSLLMLAIYDEIARSDGEHGEDAEEEIAEEEKLGLGLEELLVELELVPAHRGQILVIDHVVMARQIDVVELMDPNDDHKRDEVHRVDGLMAIFHEEGGDEEAKRGTVHTPSEDVVEAALLAFEARLVLLFSDHGVDHDAEGDEERVLCEEQNNEQAADVPVGELVDTQVENDDRLEAEQALGLAPALADVRPGVEVEPANHEQGHHATLQNDPTLFDSVAD